MGFNIGHRSRIRMAGFSCSVVQVIVSVNTQQFVFIETATLLVHTFREATHLSASSLKSIVHISTFTIWPYEGTTSLRSGGVAAEPWPQQRCKDSTTTQTWWEQLLHCSTCWQWSVERNVEVFNTGQMYWQYTGEKVLQYCFQYSILKILSILTIVLPIVLQQ